MTTADLAFERDGNDHVHIAVSGEIDLANAELVEQQFDDIIATAARITIDLGGLTYLDSQGINILAGLARRHLDAEFALTLIAPLATPARDLLVITGLTEVVPVLEMSPEPTAEESAPRQVDT